MTKIQCKIEQSASLFLIFIFVMMSISLLPMVDARISIFSIDPSSGSVGTTVMLKGNLTTTDGAFKIQYDDTEILTGNAIGTQVNASFMVPESIAGNHTVTLIDVSTAENDSTIFTVSPSYYMNISVPQAPRQLQEGDSVSFSINVTGGAASQIYVANVTVKTPANATFPKALNVSTSASGTGFGSLIYPNDFPAGANTSLVGVYEVAFNETLSTGSFTVGLTNSTEYHRLETVYVKAVYKQNEAVNLTISGKDLRDSINLTADDSGVIQYTNFTVPTNTSIGTYMVSIFSVSTDPTVKSPPDSQNFTVPGFDVNVTARNLAGDRVQNVEIRAFENGVSLVNSTTDSNGLAVLKLEIGNYFVQAHFRSVTVGQSDIEVAEAVSVDVVCNLTDLAVELLAIVNGNPIVIPEAVIFLTPDNTTLITDINGLAVAQSLLPNVTYTLNVSRYGVPFNLTTITSLLVNEAIVPWFNLTRESALTCPSFALLVDAVDSAGQPIRGAHVQAQESLGGILYEGDTDNNGAISFDAAFGKYDITIFDNGIQLNETTVSVFQNQTVIVYCDLYGLNVSVRVLDYFGQGFSNVNVVLQRKGSQPITQSTQPDGTATFNNVIGGTFEVAVYLGGQTDPTAAETVEVNNSTSIQVKMDRYVLVAGFMIDTSQLVITIIIVLTLAIVLALEIYLRRRSKPQKSESQSLNS